MRCAWSRAVFLAVAALVVLACVARAEITDELAAAEQEDGEDMEGDNVYIALRDAQDPRETDADRDGFADAPGDARSPPPPPASRPVTKKGGASDAFISSFSVIMVSEIGDKTFLIAALMAMRHPRIVVYAGAASALVVMTVLSTLLGYALPNLLSRAWTEFLAMLLFLFFGARMIHEASGMSGGEVAEEMESVALEIEESRAGDAGGGGGGGNGASLEDGQAAYAKAHSASAYMGGVREAASYFFSPVAVQTFIMTFLGEWGDRSQIATIALAAAKNPYWVTIGALLGHLICTAIAVMGGKLLASKISVRTVTLMGGALFILFGLITLFDIVRGTGAG